MSPYVFRKSGVGYQVQRRRDGRLLGDVRDLGRVVWAYVPPGLYMSMNRVAGSREYAARALNGGHDADR